MATEKTAVEVLEFDELIADGACVSVAGVRVCVEIRVSGGKVQLCVSVGPLRKCINVAKAGSFKLEVGVARIRIEVKNFSSSGGRIRFRLKVRACVGPCVPVLGCAEVCATVLNKQINLGLAAFDAKAITGMSTSDQLLYLQLASAALSQSNDDMDMADEDGDGSGGDGGQG